MPISRRTAPAGLPDGEAPLSVSDLTARMKDVLERQFPSVWVVGEISNFSRPQSGHCYLTLKDDRSQIRAVIWRSAAARLRFDLEDGLEVVCHGSIDLYAARGTYQLVLDEIHPRGLGDLELRLRQLREKLSREGLFDAVRKRPLPPIPKSVAFVTSPTGAAVRDFLEVLRRRWRRVDILIVPTRVQGDGAAEEIAQAIQDVNRLSRPIDVLVVGRGGGSMEDLWCFNEESVVRAICASRIPVISAVGHEIDVTLADLAADVRALTPSEAAERIAPAAEEIANLLATLRRRITVAARNLVGSRKVALQRLQNAVAFRKPFELIHLRSRTLDELASRSQRSIRRITERARLLLERASGKLDSLSPLRVLARGYSVTRRVSDGKAITDAGELAVGELIETVVAHGQLSSRIERIDPPR